MPPKGVVILKLLIQNGVSISEAFCRTGYNISNALACSAVVFWVGENLVRVRNIVVAAIFDFMTVEDWGE